MVEKTLSRRELLALAAAGAPAVALGSRWTPPAWGQAPSPIVKPLPPEWFVRHGTNAEMRWEAMRDQRPAGPERALLRAQPHLDAADRRRPRGGCACSAAGCGAPHGIALGYDELRPPRDARDHRGDRVRGQRPPVLRGPAGHAGPGHAVAARRASALARWRGVPLRGGARARRPAPRRRRRDARGPRRHRDAPTASTRATCAARCRSARRSTTRCSRCEMNGEELPPDHGFPVRLVVPGWIGIASIKWVGSIEVSPTRLTSPWNTKWYRMTGPAYPPDSPPLTEQPVKSAFELPWDARAGSARGARSSCTGAPGPAARRSAASTSARTAAPRWRARAPARAEPRARLGALDAAVALARARPPRAAGPRDRPRRARAARHGAVQRQRLPVLGRGAAPRARDLSRPPGTAGACSAPA